MEKRKQKTGTTSTQISMLCISGISLYPRIHALFVTDTERSTDINTWKALDSNRLSMNYKFMEIYGFRRNSIQ